MTNRVTAYLLPEEKQALEEYCKTHSISKSEALRGALKKLGSLDKNPNFLHVIGLEEYLKGLR